MKKMFFPLQFIIFSLLIIQCNAQVNVSANPFYNVKLSVIDPTGGAPFQAFATGRKGDTLLLITGRTNGFHNFPTIPVAAFPSNRSNDSVIVFIPGKTSGSSQTYKAALSTILTPPSGNTVITNNQIYQLSSTNIQSCQSGDTLYGIGGYGYNGNMTTFAGCFAINIPNMIKLVIAGVNPSTSDIKKAIVFAADNILGAVTGGELIKMNNQYYLVTGQFFAGEYNNNPYDPKKNPIGYIQLYTSSIMQLNFNWTSDSSFNCAAKILVTDPVNLHRRDLNVVPIVTASGSQAIHVYGGVFTTTAAGGPYLHPVEITGSGNNIAVKTDSLNQYFNQYAAAHFSIFDTASNTMFTTILGGITLYDSVGKSANNSNVNIGDSTMPWSSIISTMVKNNATGSITEYASDTERLPGLIGGESKFIPYQQFVLPGTDDIINSRALYNYVDSVQKVDGKAAVSIPIGWMFGGIVSSIAQTAHRSQTQSNPALYSVSITLTGLQAAVKKQSKPRAGSKVKNG